MPEMLLREPLDAEHVVEQTTLCRTVNHSMPNLLLCEPLNADDVIGRTTQCRRYSVFPIGEQSNRKRPAHIILDTIKYRCNDLNSYS